LIFGVIAGTFLPSVIADHEAVFYHSDQVSIPFVWSPFEHLVTSVQEFHADSFSLLIEHYKSISRVQEFEEMLVETGVKELLGA
jgi:hypothetical protein